VSDAQKAFGQIDRNNAQIAQDQKLLRDVPPNSLAARDIRDDIAARQRQNVQLEAKAKEATDLAAGLSKQNQATTLAASAQKANAQNALHSFNHFNTASLNRNPNSGLNTFQRHFNTASLNRNPNGGFSTFKRHFNTATVNRNPNGGFSTFKRHFNTANVNRPQSGRFGSFVQRRTANNGVMAFRSRPNFGQFNRARQQFHGFHSSGPRFASFGGGFRRR
jgi:hypothetical protein